MKKDKVLKNEEDFFLIDEKKRKRWPKEVPPETAQKMFFSQEMFQEIKKQLRQKKTDFEQPRKRKEKEKKNEET